MTAIAIILAVVLLVALLRLGIAVEYGEDGFSADARIGPLNIRVLPVKKRPAKDQKRKIRKAKKEKAAGKARADKKPGSFSEIQKILDPAKTVLDRLRRKLLIKRLTIRYIAADSDPAKAAMAFGRMNAVYGVVFPLLEKYFRIKRRDFRASADFELEEPYIYINAIISIAIWEALYISFALLPVLISSSRKAIKTDDRKDDTKNGQATDQ